MVLSWVQKGSEDVEENEKTLEELMDKNQKWPQEQKIIEQVYLLTATGAWYQSIQKTSSPKAYGTKFESTQPMKEATTDLTNDGTELLELQSNENI